MKTRETYLRGLSQRIEVAGLPENLAFLLDEISQLPNEDRLFVRRELQDRGVELLPRNLFYNYTTQEWIEEE